jgi:hypothetical protein
MGEQADLWKTDCDKFKDFSDNREGEKNRIMADYKQNLIEQMEIRKNKDKKWRCGTNFARFFSKKNCRYESK